MAKVVISESTARKIVKHLKSEIIDLRKRLKIIELELKSLEEKYGVSSIDLEKMISGEKPWSLPEDADLDVVEWEALIEQRKILRQKLEELEKLWKDLRQNID